MNHQHILVMLSTCSEAKLVSHPSGCTDACAETVDVGFRILELVAEAEPEALQPLEAAATVIQKHWRGVKVSVHTNGFRQISTQATNKP